jgi:peptidylprolyl isomerase
MIENGKIVSVNYVGRFVEDGVVFDSSEDREPLKFQVGSGQIIPGFENAIIGKSVGDKVVATISPEDGYGLIREDLLVSVPLDKMPGAVEVGQTLEAIGDNEQVVHVIIKEVNEDHVIIDGNHPLASKHLEFEIEILEVE